MKNQFIESLFTRISPSSLGFIRIVFGLIMIEEYLYFQDYFTNSLGHSLFHATYDGFHWVKMMPVEFIQLFFFLMIGSLVMFILGIHYRIHSLIQFFGFSYVFLLDKGHYNNHFYLYILLFLLFAISKADNWGSPKAYFTKDKASLLIPRWMVLAIQLQFFIVYFYGGLAKIHLDWFSGFPMRFWLYDMAYKYPEPISQFLKSEFGALFFSYSGLIFDLTIGFLLLNRRTLRLAMIPVLFFHTSNMFLWSIGNFPYVMIATSTIFFAPDWADKFVVFLRNKPIEQMYDFFKATPVKNTIAFFSPFNKIAEKKPALKTNILSIHRKIVLGFFIVFFSFQTLYPLRMWAYPGHPSWTGEGHLFAWRMMLVDTLDAIKMKVIIPDTGEVIYVDFGQYMNWRQFRKMRRTPKSLLKFTHFIRDEIKEKGGIDNPVINLEIWKSVNERPPKLLNDTTLNYAEVDYTLLQPIDWLTDWKESDVKPTFSLEKYQNWHQFIEENNDGNDN